MHSSCLRATALLLRAGGTKLRAHLGDAIPFRDMAEAHTAACPGSGGVHHSSNHRRSLHFLESDRRAGALVSVFLWILRHHFGIFLHLRRSPDPKVVQIEHAMPHSAVAARHTWVCIAGVRSRIKSPGGRNTVHSVRLQAIGIRRIMDIAPARMRGPISEE